MEELVLEHPMAFYAGIVNNNMSFTTTYRGMSLKTIFSSSTKKIVVEINAGGNFTPLFSILDISMVEKYFAGTMSGPDLQIRFTEYFKGIFIAIFNPGLIKVEDNYCYPHMITQLNNNSMEIFVNKICNFSTNLYFCINTEGVVVCHRKTKDRSIIYGIQLGPITDMQGILTVIVNRLLYMIGNIPV
jgi:hypothetical protein